MPTLGCYAISEAEENNWRWIHCSFPGDAHTGVILPSYTISCFIAMITQSVYHITLCYLFHFDLSYFTLLAMICCSASCLASCALTWICKRRTIEGTQSISIRRSQRH